MTAREQEVLRLVAQGHSNAQIADTLFISVPTVKRHLTIIFDKTGMSSRLELAMYAVKHGIGK